MKKKISLGAAIAIAAAAAVITGCFTCLIMQESFWNAIQDFGRRDALTDKISELDVLIQEKYYKEPDQQLLEDALSSGFLAGLNDPYSVYYTEEEYQSKKLSNDGMRVGIGVTVHSTEAGYTEIISVSEQGPADKAGLLSGDLIIAVDGESVMHETLSEVVKRVGGKENTEVALTIRRHGEDRDYRLLRERFELQTVSCRITDGIALIQITGFNQKTPDQFEAALAEVKQQNAEGIIFDLRNNGGGLLTGVCSCLDLLVGEGELVTARYRNGETKVLHSSDAEEFDLPMVVVQNKNTASAAELFSATLRDYGKAAIVGTKSFGKGIMQTLYTLSDGSAVNLTTAEFLPYSGECFHGIGIEPDYSVELTGEEEQSFLLGELERDPQLLKAEEVLKLQN